MIYLHQARLVILSQPKTGTTALDKAMAGRASIAVSHPPQIKHMQYPRFMKFIAPWIESQLGFRRSDYEVVSVMREPVDWLGSWYRYRRRDALKIGATKRSRSNYTGDVSFEDFVCEVLKPKRERLAFANLGNPCGVSMASNGCIGCDRVYPYEDLSGLYGLIQNRMGRSIELAKLNVSPAADMSLSDETRERLRAHWAFAFDLHASLNVDGKIDRRFKVAGSGGATLD